MPITSQTSPCSHFEVCAKDSQKHGGGLSPGLIDANDDPDELRGCLLRTFSLSKAVLVVDDLEILRKMVRDFLESMGITVLEASNAAEAIHTAHSHQRTIDLLLTDIEMPRMSGWKLANKLVRSRPEIRILYMSAGISLQEWNDHKEKPVGTYFIQKPFRLEEVKTVVMAILSEE